MYQSQSDAALFRLSLVLGLLSCFSGDLRGQSVSGLSLHAAIEQAQTSPQAREAQDLVDASRGGVTQAGLRPNLRLYLQSEDIRPWADNFSFANQTEDYGEIAQLLEPGGKRSRRLGVAQAIVRRSEAERVLLLQQIAGRVAAAYWSVVASEGIARLLEEDMRTVDAIVLYNKERVQAGAMRGVDLLRVQIERDRLELSLAAARREALLTRIELFKEMGREPNSEVKLTDSLDTLNAIQTQTPASVLLNRADVTVAHEAAAAAEAEIKLQLAQRVPDVDIFGGYKRNSGTNTLYTALQIPLPFANRNQGEIERARANLRAAQDRVQQLELTVRADVTAAEQAYASQQRIVREVLPEMRARAKQNLTIMDDAYRTGGVDLLRYLDAERTAVDVEVTALRTLAEFQQAGLRLQLAYGVRP